ncbi:hypothetical protein K6U70_09180 [Vibrio vulnificus]|nr:hypothetical protein [Vibrio vulnificus]
MRKLGLCGIHPLTRRYVSARKIANHGIQVKSQLYL